MPAETKDGKVAQDRLKAKVAAERLVEDGQVAVVEVGDAPACPADKVVMGVLAHDLKLDALPAEVDLAEDTQVAQLLEGAVDGGEVNGGVIAGEPGVHPFRAGVAIEGTEGVQDDLALAGEPEAGAAGRALESLKVTHDGLPANCCR